MNSSEEKEGENSTNNKNELDIQNMTNKTGNTNNSTPTNEFIVNNNNNNNNNTFYSLHSSRYNSPTLVTISYDLSNSSYDVPSEMAKLNVAQSKEIYFNQYHLSDLWKSPNKKKINPNNCNDNDKEIAKEVKESTKIINNLDNNNYNFKDEDIKNKNNEELIKDNNNNNKELLENNEKVKENFENKNIQKAKMLENSQKEINNKMEKEKEDKSEESKSKNEV